MKSQSTEVLQRPRGLLWIVILQWTITAVLAVSGLSILLFVILTRNSSTSGLTPLGGLLVGAAGFLTQITRGLWQLRRGSYFVTLFVYLLATLCQVIAIVAGQLWYMVLPMIGTGFILGYLFLPRMDGVFSRD